MQATPPVQLPLPELAGPWAGPAPTLDERRLTGAWAAGERWLSLGGRDVEAAVWFRFAPAGRAAVSIRWEEDGRRVTLQARWCLAGRQLTLTLPRGVIRGPARLSAGILHWAGEALVRVPPETAGATARSGDLTLPRVP